MQSRGGKEFKTAHTSFSWPLQQTCMHIATAFPGGSEGRVLAMAFPDSSETFITSLPRNWFPSWAQGWLTHLSSSCMNYQSLWHSLTSSLLQDCAGPLIISIRKLLQVFGHPRVSKSYCHWWSGTGQHWPWTLNWTLMTHFPIKSGSCVIFYLGRQVYLYFPALK